MSKKRLTKNQARRKEISRGYGQLKCPRCSEQRWDRASLDNHIYHVHINGK